MVKWFVLNYQMVCCGSRRITDLVKGEKTRYEGKAQVAFPMMHFDTMQDAERGDALCFYTYKPVCMHVSYQFVCTMYAS